MPDLHNYASTKIEATSKGEQNKHPDGLYETNGRISPRSGWTAMGDDVIQDDNDMTDNLVPQI
jgi:hypothetical protein